MTKNRKATMITERTSKYRQCPVCKLNIRCGNVEQHAQGIHHRKSSR